MPKKQSIFDHLEAYSGIFLRPDHWHWFVSYVWGLIHTPGRKTINAIARSLPPALALGASPAQSIHHFLNRSAWSEERLMERLRELSRNGEQNVTWAVLELSIPKSGKHSIGVRRQFLRREGTKRNSQSSIIVASLCKGSFVPIGVRLYLPQSWLREATSDQLAHVPEENQKPCTKEEIACQLVQECVKQGGRPAAIVAPIELTADGVLEAICRDFGITLSVGLEIQDFADGKVAWMKQTLGMDHYEGRSWHGWHRHMACVSVAAELLQR